MPGVSKTMVDRPSGARERSVEKSAWLYCSMGRTPHFRNSAGKICFMTFRLVSMYETPLGTRRLSSRTTKRPSGKRGLGLHVAVGDLDAILNAADRVPDLQADIPQH